MIMTCEGCSIWGCEYRGKLSYCPKPVQMVNNINQDKNLTDKVIINTKQGKYRIIVIEEE